VNPVNTYAFLVLARVVAAACRDLLRLLCLRLALLGVVRLIVVQVIADGEIK